MNKLMMIVIVAALALTGCDGVPDGNTYPLTQPQHEYEIDTWGTNSEVYEFTPKSNPAYTCVFVMLDSGNAMGLQCFPKATRQITVPSNNTEFDSKIYTRG